MSLRCFNRSVLPSEYSLPNMKTCKTKIAPNFRSYKYWKSSLLEWGRSYFNFVSSEIVNFFRPFLRRAANTLRPLAVSMRLRKPWTVLRRFVWGWNVRFILIIFIPFWMCLWRNRLVFQTPGRAPSRPVVKGTAKVMEMRSSANRFLRNMPQGDTRPPRYDPGFAIT